MTDSPNRLPIPARSPFNHPRADIILRSSDNIDFSTFKNILSLSSPIFNDMFDLPQPSSRSGSQVEKDVVAVVEMVEDGKTLEMLLRFCYPGEDLVMESIEDARELLTAALKYQIDFITSASKKRLLAFAEREPLRVFAISCIAGVNDLAKDAAKFALQKSEAELLPSGVEVLPPELASVSAENLMKLLFYHQVCVGRISKNFDAVFRTLWKPGEGSRCPKCGQNPPPVVPFTAGICPSASTMRRNGEDIPSSRLHAMHVLPHINDVQRHGGVPGEGELLC
ncbi:hypothetical protein JAAARDRAFT_174609 [Jaapia argillacea MUCL 33604]|uniref:BTB domain-containing protein n=1 Tax=Jaapia argillacea MUCL 33604 TaxID=933084 RepID=A0A067Q0K6_9AGAM|nr:hypothetical protein JAAARDRAFT_174609 [Jaapia argillacea MUCL 33604]